MVQSLLAAALLGIGALAAERVAGWFGRPRRAAWTATLAGSLLLPALSLLFPGVLPDLGILPDARGAMAADASALQWLGSGGAAVTGAPIAASSPFWTDLSHLLVLAWLALSLIMLAALGWTYRRIRAARAETVATEVDGVQVQVADRLGPAVVGLRRPAIVLPRWVLEAPAEERRLILLHEREHLASGDGWLLFLGALAVAAMPWCLPLWWQHRRLRVAVETDCDARVLSRGFSRRIYGQILIRTAGGRPLLPLLNPAWGETTSQLERRIMRMTEKKPSHRLLRSAPLVALAVGVVATACDVAGRANDPAAPDLATGPTAHSSTPQRSGVTDPGGGRMVMEFYVRTPAAREGSLGLGWLTWEEVKGPAFRDGKVVPPKGHPKIGNLATTGALWKAGIRDGDILLAVNGTDGSHPHLFRDAAPGSHYSIRIRRGGEEREFQVVLE
jgi:beta-lactamase regulating signal transducer with metallopeptidase domain